MEETKELLLNDEITICLDLDMRHTSKNKYGCMFGTCIDMFELTKKVIFDKDIILKLDTACENYNYLYHSNNGFSVVELLYLCVRQYEHEDMNYNQSPVVEPMSPEETEKFPNVNKLVIDAKNMENKWISYPHEKERSRCTPIMHSIQYNIKTKIARLDYGI